MKRILIAFIVFGLSVLSAGAQNLKLRADNIDEIIAAMTLDEKIHTITGCGAGWGKADAKFPGNAGWTYAIDRLGIPSVYFADGPLGINIDAAREFDCRDYSSTFFLSGPTLAATWDLEEAYQIGSALGYEVLERGLDIILGPGNNIHRNALCGRNQEYFSEDPLLSGWMAAQWINGVQSNGVGTSLKHFAANNQETNRNANDARISQRALREIYLKPFEIAVKNAHPWTIMSSYNKINGVYTAENRDLMNGVLRKDWGYEGAVMSDWGAVHNAPEAPKADMNVIESGTDADRAAILKAYEEGRLSMEEIDHSVRHMLELVVKCPSFRKYAFSNEIRREEHQALLRRIAADGMVLLKNQDAVLPLKGTEKVALYGNTSVDFIPANMGPGGANMGYYHVSLVQGLRDAGFEVYMPLVRQIDRYIKENKERQLADVPAFLKGYTKLARPAEMIPSDEKEEPVMPSSAGDNPMANFGFMMGSSTPVATLSEQVAYNDLAIVTLGRTTGEAADRKEEEFYLTESESALIKTVSSAYHGAGKKVVVLLNIPTSIETVSWRDQVDVILFVGQPGERAGESVADALTGKVAPSGRLVDTWPVQYGDAAADKNFPSDYEDKPFDISAFGRPQEEAKAEERNVDYTVYEEGIYVGYRYFSTAGVPVAYPFGYGLSYTGFQRSDASVVAVENGFKVSVTVTNTGKSDGRDVVQLYVTAPAGGLEKPAFELKGFAKTRTLRPGESETVEITVPRQDLASFNEKSGEWQVAKGVYTLRLCADSDTQYAELTYKVDKAEKWAVGNYLKPKEPIKELSLRGKACK